MAAKVKITYIGNTPVSQENDTFRLPMFRPFY